RWRRRRRQRLRRRASRGGGGKMGSFVPAESLAGGEDPVAVWALEYLGIAIGGIGIRGILAAVSDPGDRKAFYPHPLVARAVAAESLIRSEVFLARTALVPRPLPPRSSGGLGLRLLLLLLVIEFVLFVLVGVVTAVGLASFCFAPGPGVAGEQHEAAGDVLVGGCVRDGAEWLGVGGRILSAARAGEPPSEGRLRVALSVLDDRKSSAAGSLRGGDGRGELRIDKAGSSPGFLAEAVRRRRRHTVLIRRREGGRGCARRREVLLGLHGTRGSGDVGAHVAAEGAAIGEAAVAELASVPLHGFRTGIFGSPSLGACTLCYCSITSRLLLSSFNSVSGTKERKRAVTVVIPLTL
ncbi:unnamed protein product, partial [Musa acuminata var. zebrina]